MVEKGFDIKKYLNIISHGIRPLDKSLFPISSHFGEILFDVDKLETYFDKKVTLEHYATMEQIEGEDFQKFIAKFSEKFCAGTSGKYPGACFAGSVAAEFKVQGENISEKKFVFSNKKILRIRKNEATI